MVVGKPKTGFYNEACFSDVIEWTKDGKTHHYWNVVESRRLSDRRVVQRQVLYLGEINDSQREAWRKTIEVHDEGARRQVALFPAGSMPGEDAQALGLRLDEYCS